MIALLLAAAAVAPGAFELQSPTLTLQPGARTAIATGGVVADGNGLHIECDEAEAAYGQEEGRRVLEALHLRGHVNVHRTSDGLDATAAAADWVRTEKTLVLSGDPVVRRASDVLKGDRLTLGLEDDSLEATEARATLAPKKGRGEVLDVRADRLVVRDAGRRLVMDGRVRLTQGDVSARADHGTADLPPRADTSTRSAPSRVSLSGNVEASRRGQRGTAGRADYDAATGELALEGNPVLEQDGERLTGARIVLDGPTGTARVTNAVARVRSRP